MFAVQRVGFGGHRQEQGTVQSSGVRGDGSGNGGNTGYEKQKNL